MSAGDQYVVQRQWSKLIPALAMLIIASSVLAMSPQDQYPSSSAANLVPQEHLNRAIAPLAKGMPAFAIQAMGGSGYDEGKRLSNSVADFIIYEMEYGTFDLTSLRLFMKGLSQTGNSQPRGRTPVIVTLPILGSDPASMKANVWMVQQVLAAGVSGILLCQAESPEAVRIFVEATRYAFAPGADRDAGHRGFHSEAFAASIWGISPEDYLKKADPWPLNKNGEILLGIKIENPRAVEHAEELANIPGIAFVEWGPGDQSYYLFSDPLSRPLDTLRQDPKMVASRARVVNAAKAANVLFLSGCSENSVLNELKSGTRICLTRDVATIEKGRSFARTNLSDGSYQSLKPQ